MRHLILATVLLPLAAAAQDELGLDFSDAKTPLEFRPAIAFVGVSPEQAEEPIAVRAKLLEAEFIKLLNESEKFSVVKTPVDAAGVSTTARKCLDFACLETLAEKLGVHRIITCTLAKAGPGTVLTINGFDPTLPAVLPLQVESGEKDEKAKIGGFAGIKGKTQAQRDQEFVAKVRGPFGEMTKNIATPLGKLFIDVIEQSAVTKVKGKEAGTGSFSKLMPVGNYDLEVTSNDYLPFTQSVAIEPMKSVEVKVTLIAKPVEAKPDEPLVAQEAPVFYKRPGVYVALAGAILMAVGFGFGMQAKTTEGRAVDNNPRDGVIDITRSMANTAKTQALLANVFVPLGAVAIAAGAVWAFVVPMLPMFQTTGPAKPAGPPPGNPSDSSGSGFGLVGGVGGKF